MAEFAVRSLAGGEIGEHRRLYTANPDAYAACVVQRFPAYYEVATFFDPDGTYAKRQRLVLGAFTNGKLVGTVGVQRTECPSETEIDGDRWDTFSEAFSEQDLTVFSTWTEALQRTFIGAPNGSLTLHSLAVDPEYRRMGVASRLVRAAVCELNEEERTYLYTEVVRTPWMIRLFESLSFVTIQKTLSLSERLEFGCWGSVLMQFRDSADN